MLHLPRSDEQAQGFAANQYCDLNCVRARLSLSARTLRSFIKDEVNPLPAYRVGGKLLFKWVEVERWIRRYRVADVDHNLALEDLAAQALSSLVKRERRV